MRAAISRFLDRLFRKAADALLARARENLLHPHVLLLQDAQRDSAAFAKEHMGAAVIRNSGDEVLGLALSRAPATGAILEFGVAAGDSIRFLAGRTDRLIHGFDSFEGLPEDWGGRHETAGHYSQGGRLPPVPGNVILHKGWFEDTLPAWRAAHDDRIALLHMDADLYSSTKTVLDGLADRIGPGTVIVFDEYFNYVGWRNHEHKAFGEFVDDGKVRFRYLAWAYQQVAVVIESIGE